jgi:hypothetical protein
MSGKAKGSQSAGPQWWDLHETMCYLQDQYPVLITVEMVPLASQQGLFNVVVSVTLKPRTATQHLVNATARPEALLWEAQWSESHLLGLTSLLFRGLFEVEIALVGWLEQMGLPL